MARVESPNQYKYTGKGPLDQKLLVSTYAELLSWDTWSAKSGSKIAYNGMITAVWLNKADTTKNGIYFLFDPDCTSTIKNPDVTNEVNWHKLVDLDVLSSESEARIAAFNAITAKLGEIAENKTIVEMIAEAEQAVKGYADSLVSGFESSYAAELSTIKTIAEAAQTEAEVIAIVNSKLSAELSQYAKALDLDAVSDTLATKVDKNAYEEDKASFANKSEVSELASSLATKADIVVLNNYYTKDAIDSKGYLVSADVENTYATIAALNDYAKADEVAAALNTKIESATIKHSNENLPEGVTVDGTVLNIVVDAYSKKETLEKIDEVIGRINDNSETAASVNSRLTSHIETYQEKVGQLDAAIAAVQATAEQGKAKAEEVAGNLNTLSAVVDDHADSIAVITENIQTISNNVTALTNKDTELNTLISTLADKVEDEILPAIATLQSADEALNARITANTEKFTDYYDKSEVDSAIALAIENIPAVDLEPYAKQSDVETALSQKANVSDVNDIAATLATKANAADVYTKVEIDNKGFLNQDAVDARIDSLINAADPEGGKTISNIQKLVEYVDQNAGSIVGLVRSVSDHTNAIEAINATLAATVQPKESDEISVDHDGTLEIKKVSISKLSQDEGEVLVLNGGSAVGFSD